MKRLRFLLAATGCASLWATTAQAVICPPTVCGPPHVTLWFWGDGNPPCNTTLQACIDLAAPGDVVVIDTNGPIAESVSFSKALTLEAYTGFAPVFEAGQSVEAGTDTSAADQTIVIQGLTLESGHIGFLQQGTGTATIQILDNTIQSGLGGGISIKANAATGPISFQISGNDLSVPLTQGDGAFIQPIGSASASGVVSGNHIAMVDVGLGGILSSGILLNTDGALMADVIGNRITGEGPKGVGLGIYVLEAGTGTIGVRIFDNLVTRAAQSDAATAILASATSGQLSVQIVNNTVAASGIGISADSSSSGNTVGTVANNVITGNNQGLEISSVGIVSNRNNLFFGNQTDVAVVLPGPGSVFDDPLYVGPGDYHLQPGSPAIDAGDDASVPADLATDLDGNPRIQGSHVDIGAYETAPEPATELGAAASVSVLAALAPRRRR